MVAICNFSLEAGTSTLLWRARSPLRREVKKSAIGSVTFMFLASLLKGQRPSRHPSYQLDVFYASLPARLCHARDISLQSQLAEAQAADLEFTQESAGPSATFATV